MFKMKKCFLLVAVLVLALVLTCTVYADLDYLDLALANNTDYDLGYIVSLDSDFDLDSQYISDTIDSGDDDCIAVFPDYFPEGKIYLFLGDSEGAAAKYILEIDSDNMLIVGSPFYFSTDGDDNIELTDCDGNAVKPVELVQYEDDDIQYALSDFEGEPGEDEVVYYEADYYDMENDYAEAEEDDNCLYYDACIYITNYLTSSINQVYVKPSDSSEWSGNMISWGTSIPVGSRCICDGTINYHKNTLWDIYIYTDRGGWFRSKNMSFKDVEDPFNITIEVFSFSNGTYDKNIY